MDEEQFVCQDCGHHEYYEAGEWEEPKRGASGTLYECTNCFHEQDSFYPALVIL